MAIGNVGTYATVEGAPVDFGKMIASNIDRYRSTLISGRFTFPKPQLIFRASGSNQLSREF